MFKIKINAKMNFFVKAAILIYICFALISIIKLQFKLNELKNEKILYETQIEQYSDNIAQVAEQLAQPFDDDYVMRVAKDKLNYRQPEEIIFYNDLLK